jgi:DNA-binding transcriptional ArsR family regulator
VTAKTASHPARHPRGVDATLAALADPQRRRTVELLRERPRPAGELARSLGLPAPAMSRHLRTLKECGLLEDSHPTFDARVRVYALRTEPMIELARWLEETERMWSEQLAAFKEHLENAPEDKVGEA